jgi:transposase InsO family protein
MTFEFIAAHRDEYRVSRMCEVLGVSSSGFYAWQDREPSMREQENAALVIDIRQVYDHSRQTYGSPRIHAELQAMGRSVSRKRVARLMRINGIQAKRKQRYQTTTRRNPSVDPVPNLIAQDFNAQAANDKWLADITYIDTHEGWLYLAAILAVYSRKIVGWSMSQQLQKHLVEDALRMAVGQRDLRGGLVHHSDQGSQYTSHDFLALLQQHNIQVSMSGVGNCYDNAMMESFFATLKTECVTERFETRQQARQLVFEYIEVWYNRCRRHSALGYLSPEQYEQRVA